MPNRSRCLGHQRFSRRSGHPSDEYISVHGHRPCQRFGCGRRDRSADHAPFPGIASVVWSLLAGRLAACAGLLLSALSRGNMDCRAGGGGSECGDSDVCEAFATDFRVSGSIRLYPGWNRRLAHLPTEGNAGRPEDWACSAAGIGFAGFFICAHKAAMLQHCGGHLFEGRCFSGYGSHRPFRRHLRAVAAPVLAIAVVADFSTSRQHCVHPRGSNRTTRRGGCTQFALSAVTVVLARIFLHEHFSRTRTSAWWRRWRPCR